jgi:phage baseplate assembly protein V
LIADVRAGIRALNNRVMLTVARAVVSLVDDTTKLQSLQLKLLRREIRENVERFQNYGFTGKPHAGAEAVVVFVGGNRDHGLCIAVDDRRYRVKGLEDGEVAIYTDEGDTIVLKRNRVIEVTTETFRVNASTKVEINSPLLEVNTDSSTFSGDVDVVGDVSDANGSMQEMRDTYNDHTHPSNATQPPTQQMI